MTLTPSAASPRAIALPMPLLPPEITATRPFSPSSIATLRLLQVDVVEESRRPGAIDDPVIARQGERQHRPDLDAPVDRGRHVADGADGENPRLRRHQHRRERIDTEHSEIAD